MSSQFGDFKGFGISFVYIIMYVIGYGYYGGAALLMSSNLETLDKIYPTEITKPPYMGDPTKTSDFFLAFIRPPSDNGITYPYTLYSTKGNEFGTVQYKNWLLLTAMTATRLLRLVFKKFYHFWQMFTEPTNFLHYLGELFVFFTVPFIITSSGFCMFIGICILFIIMLAPNICSVTKVLDKPWMYAFAPFFLPLQFITSKPTSVFTLCITMPLMFVFGILLTMFFHWPYWITLAVYLFFYSFVLIYISPLLIPNGFSSIFHEITKKKFYLFLIFVYMVINASNQYMVPHVTLGIKICAAAIFIGMFINTYFKKQLMNLFKKKI